DTARRRIDHRNNTGDGPDQGAIAIDVEMVGRFTGTGLPGNLQATGDQLKSDVGWSRRRRAVGTRHADNRVGAFGASAQGRDHVTVETIHGRQVYEVIGRNVVGDQETRHDEG